MNEIPTPILNGIAALQDLHISADRVPGIDLSEPGAIQQAQEAW